MPIPLVAAALSAIAPSLAKKGLDLLSGVFRGALDKGTQEIADLIEEKTGIDINNAAEDKLTDDQWSKLKQFEFDYQMKLLEYRQQADANTLEEERIHQADRADARSMHEKELESDSVIAKNFIYFYALVLTTFTCVYIFWASFCTKGLELGEQNWRVIDTVLGFLLGVTLSAIIQYFFGSSAGSKAKQDQLSLLSKGVLSATKQAKSGKGGDK